MKKIPLRTCAITREKLEKRELFRIVRTPWKEVLYDVTGKANGKGVYLKKDLDVILKAQKTKALDRALEVEVPDRVYEILKEKLNNE